jgi:hypothetical protein
MNKSYVKIFEDSSEDDNETVSIHLRIPISFNFNGIRNDDEYKVFSMEEVRHKSAACFRLIAFLGRQSDQTGILASDLAEYMQLLGQIGAGFQEAIEDITSEFDKKIFYKCSTEEN